jgi:lipopolysaccharide/colanic/teichoic acid biosynthesis glycosyltransferase
MDKDLPLDWNGREAFWSPRVTGSYPSHGYAVYPADSESASRESGVVRLLWRGLRWHWGSLCERICLFLVVLLTAAPKIHRGVLGHCRRLCLKRAFDVVGAAAGLVLAIPFFIFIPLLIKLDSPGPVFYFQTRVGLDRRRRNRRVLAAGDAPDRRSTDRRQLNQSGRIFKLIKFRSMVHNAERSCGPVWASQNDPRITRLGGFLRRTRIDEIPQLINVLCGQMSLVGPRPERPHFVSRFCDTISRYPYRQTVKPGITGLAQVEHGYDRNEEDVLRKVGYDLKYIAEWNPALDVKILLKTVRVVLSGRGAH